jgi:hypothetical protein
LTRRTVKGTRHDVKYLLLRDGAILTGCFIWERRLDTRTLAWPAAWVVIVVSAFAPLFGFV